MWFSRKDEIFTEERMINAVEYNDISFMKDYIKNGSDVTFETFDECYPNLLFYARSAEAVKVLVQAGIDINSKSKYEKNENTPLHYAVLRNNQELIAALVQHGANVNAFNAKKKTPFFLALQKHQLNTVQIMLSGKPDFHLVDSNKNTALHYLSAWQNETDTKELLDLRLAFIQAGADTNAQNAAGKTPAQLIRHQEENHVVFPFNKRDKIVILTPRPLLKKIKENQHTR